MEKIRDAFYDLEVKFYVYIVCIIQKIRNKKIFSKFIWWMMFRKYKDCKGFCPSCDYLDNCQFDTRLAYKNAKRSR